MKEIGHYLEAIQQAQQVLMDVYGVPVGEKIKVLTIIGEWEREARAAREESYRLTK